MPLVNDAISHTFDEAMHIATVHAVYGANHLQKELASTGSDTQKDQQSAKEESQIPVHVFEESCDYLFQPIIDNTAFNSIKEQILLSVSIAIHTPPPRLS